MSRTLRSDHDNVQVICRLDLIKVDVETVCKSQDVAFLHVLFDLVLVDGSLQFIRSQDHYDVTSFSSFFDAHDFKAGSFSLS